MKSSEIKKILADSRKENMIHIDKNNITSKDACIAVSCNPSRQLLRALLKEENAEYLHHNADKSLIEIEILLHKINKVSKSQVKVAAAIYISSSMGAEECAYMLNVKSASIRNLIKMIKIPKNFDAIYELDRL